MRPTLIINPRADTEFVALVVELAEVDGMTPARLEAMLRERYPAAVVRPRELSAEPIAIWYVYRDGTWTR